jgi:hypothetical protein
MLVKKGDIRLDETSTMLEFYAHLLFTCVHWTTETCEVLNGSMQLEGIDHPVKTLTQRAGATERELTEAGATVAGSDVHRCMC